MRSFNMSGKPGEGDPSAWSLTPMGETQMEFQASVFSCLGQVHLVQTFGSKPADRRPVSGFQVNVKKQNIIKVTIIFRPNPRPMAIPDLGISCPTLCKNL